MKKISANKVMRQAECLAKTSNTVPVDQGTTKKISDTGLDPYKSKNQTNACVVI